MKKQFILMIYALFIASMAFGQAFDTVSYYKKYQPKQLYQDLDFLLKKFEEIHPDYFKEIPKDTVVKRYNDIKVLITKPMTRTDFMNLLSPMAFNIVKDGHNYINAPETDFKLYTDKGGKVFPIPVKMSNRHLFVNSDNCELPNGTEIISINNRPSKEIINRILSGYNAESDAFEEILNSDWFSGEYWSWYGGFKHYTIAYKNDQDKSIKVISIPGKSSLEVDSLRNKQSLKNYSFSELPASKTGVLSYNVCDDLKNFRSFCDSVFTIMHKKQYENLIIDIRESVGGTTRLNDMLYEYLTNKPVTEYAEIETKISKDKKKDFIHANREYAGWFKWYNYLYYPIYVRLNPGRKQTMTAKNGTFITQKFTAKKPKENPLRFTGKIYLLTGTKTYSAAACFAAAIKYFNIGTIIGQETGEPTCFTGDWVGITLPHTKLECAISCKRFLLIGGKCDGHGVIPDYQVKYPESNMELKDPEMALTIKLITSGPNK